MRLEKIKLSGFKSFVDQTTVPFKHALTGIVGPNGCGKSNIIDAVRWVMGESSAKTLRGGSMSDVIFNGSEKRSPLGQAQIELIFDNSKNKILGQYANYNEISIKRVVNRDGQSSYYLNNTKCRRRDIADIFLGTGLSARSYAIIEQGMISKIIEAKPEDLRTYLEEAAGISKYKERRKETEHRMQNTRDNLVRLNDIITELDKQLLVLETQAANAKVYKTLKESEFHTQLSVLILKFVALKKQAEKIKVEIATLEENHSKINLEKDNLDAKFTKEKAEESKLQVEVQETSEIYYKIENSINNIEQEIKHLQQERNHLENEITSTDISLTEANTKLDALKTKEADLKAEYQLILPQFEAANNEQKLLQDELKKLNNSEKEVELLLRKTQDEKYSLDKATELSKSEILRFETLMRKSRENKQKLEMDIANYAIPESKHEALHAYQSELENIKNESALKEVAIETLIKEIQSKSDSLSNFESLRHSKLDALHQIQGKISSLETLQSHALGKHDNELKSNLQKYQLSNNKRLAEILEVDPKWNRVIEAIIQDNISAIAVDNFNNCKIMRLFKKNCEHVLPLCDQNLEVVPGYQYQL